MIPAASPLETHWVKLMALGAAFCLVLLVAELLSPTGRLQPRTAHDAVPDEEEEEWSAVGTGDDDDDGTASFIGGQPLRHRRRHF